VSNNGHLTKQREKMWNKNPRCERCSVITVLPKDCDGKIFNPDGIGYNIPNPPGNMATIQHRYSKCNKKRYDQTLRGRRHFLWCYQCNQEYNDLYENPGTKNLPHIIRRRKRWEKRNNKK
jgi:hypothetical protein